MNNNGWAREWLYKVFKTIEHFSPFKKLYNKLLDIEHRIEKLADNLAITALRQEFAGNTARAAIATTDANGHLTWASDEFLDIAGVTLAEALGENWMASIHQDDRPMLIAAWERAVELGSNFTYDYRYTGIESNQHCVRWVRATAKHARNPISGKIAGWVCEIIPRQPPKEYAGELQCESRHWVPPLNRPNFGTDGARQPEQS